MLTYNLDARGKMSLYEYLYLCIRNDILCGKLKEEEKMPSKREFAQNLNISIVTVQNAYEQLMAEGYIYAVEKKGYYVNKINLSRENVAGKISADTKVSEILQKQETNKYFADFKTNHIKYEKFPFSIWSKIMREILNDREKAFIQNIPSCGLVELRKAIADCLYQFRGMSVSYEQIVVGAGTEYLYGLVIQLLNNNSIVAVEDPGYKKAAEVYAAQGAQCRYIPLDKYGLIVDVLEQSDANIVHISPSHHFPTGIVMPINRRNQLLEWADKSSDRYIIEDDYDSEFRFTGRPVPTMQSIDCEEKVIYINTFSKTLMPSIRIAYMVLPRSLAVKYNEKMNFYSCTVSGFEQMALARFIEDGYYDRHINRMRNYYRGCRNMVISAIKDSALGKKVCIMEENSGLHFILKIETEMNDEEFVKKAAEQGVNISCVSQYCTNTSDKYKHLLLINYSNVEENAVKEAVRILADIANG